MNYEPKLLGSATQEMVDGLQAFMHAMWGPDSDHRYFGVPISSRLLWTEFAIQEASLSGTHAGSAKKVVTMTHELDVKEGKKLGLQRPENLLSVTGRHV